MKEVFLAVSGCGACLFSDGKALDKTFVPLDPEGTAEDIAKQIKEGLKFDFRRKKLVLAANSKKTIIRVVDANDFSHKRGYFGKKITDGDAWEVVKSVFPFGPSINEDTHLFDISLYGDNKYVCFGLPIDLCEKYAQIGKELTGSLHRVIRLETIENLIFAWHMNNSGIVVFPQDDGLRVLTVEEGLPKNAFFISNHPDRREAELERILACHGDKKAVYMLSFSTSEASDDLGWVSKYGAESFT